MKTGVISPLFSGLQNFLSKTLSTNRMTVNPLKSVIPLHNIGFFACFVCLFVCSFVIHLIPQKEKLHPHYKLPLRNTITVIMRIMWNTWIHSVDKM
jgi:hypothetical protein